MGTEERNNTHVCYKKGKGKKIRRTFKIKDFSSCDYQIEKMDYSSLLLFNNKVAFTFFNKLDDDLLPKINSWPLLFTVT
jgi:hypothetical protein